MRAWMRAASGLTLLVLCSTQAFAQTSGPGSTSQASSPPDAPARQAVSAIVDGVRLGYVDVDRVAALSNEGKAIAARLQEVRSKKTAEAAERSKQVDALQQKLSQGQSVLNNDALVRLQREFKRAQIDFQRFTEDAQAEIQEVQQELVQAFNAKLFPVIGQVAKEKNLWAVFSSNSGILWHDTAVDLSEEIARRLDGAAAQNR